MSAILAAAKEISMDAAVVAVLIKSRWNFLIKRRAEDIAKRFSLLLTGFGKNFRYPSYHPS